MTPESRVVDPDARRLKETIDTIVAYRKAYAVLARESKRGRNLVRVEVVLSSFAVEKGLKAVIHYCDHQPRVRGHDLRKLYEQLQPATKAALVRSLEVTTDLFVRALIFNAQAFERWRYGDEPREEGVMFAEPDMMLGTVDFCVASLRSEVLRRASAASGRRPRSLADAYRLIGAVGR